MFSRLGRRVQGFRRRFSRSEWVARRLQEPEQPAADYDIQAPGILMIQIDGLGHDQLLKAIEKRRLPFLQRLIQQDHFVLRRFYSGLPSNQQKAVSRLTGQSLEKQDRIQKQI